MSTKILAKEVDRLVDEELKRANEQWPLFNSAHEGESVISEEVMEATTDFDRVHCTAAAIRQNTFEDLPDIAIVEAQALRKYAICAASELIQVAAMAEKFVVSERERLAKKKENDDREEFSQEEADWLASIMPDMTEEEKNVFVCESPEFLKRNKVLMSIPKGKVKSVVKLIVKEVEEDE